MPVTPRETSVTEHEVRVAARPETVFSYFTDPSKLTQWMGAQATLDPRPGGVCRIAFQGSAAAPAGETAGVMMGEFVEVDPPRRIALTWGWEAELLALPPQSTVVEISLIPEGDETVVRLVHRQLPAAAVGFHRAGWTHYLGRLAVAAGGGDPGVDPWQVAG
jgi:uncharacterized protein YndB with AHSA1/START domain